MKNEKIKFRDRVKDISAGLGDSLKESSLWSPDWFPIFTSLVNRDPPNLGLSSAKITLAPFFAAA